MTRPLGRPQQAQAERSRDFKGSAIRLVKRLTPQRGLTSLVILLGVAGIAIGVIGPRILGHATDLLFNGVIGRQLPAGLTKEQAIAAARARGDNTFADLLSGMNVVPGRGVDFDAVGRTLLLALGLYLIAALLIWLQARILNVTIQRTMVAMRSDVEDKVHRLPLSYFDSRQRGEVLSRVTNDVDNIQTSLSMTISQLLTSMLTVVAVLVMMLTISPLLTLLTVVTVPLSLWITRAIARRSQRLFVAQWANTGRLNAHIEETYSGFTVVKTFGHRARAMEQFRECNDDVYHVELWRTVLFGPCRARDDVRRQPQLRGCGGGRRRPGRDGPDHAGQHPGVHPIRSPVQPAAHSGRRDVQHAAVRSGKRGAGFRSARRRGGAAGAGCAAAVALTGVRAAGSSSSTSTSATGQAHR